MLNKIPTPDQLGAVNPTLFLVMLRYRLLNMGNTVNASINISAGAIRAQAVALFLFSRCFFVLVFILSPAFSYSACRAGFCDMSRSLKALCMPGHGAKALPLPHMAPGHSALLVPNRHYIHASQILLIL